MHVKHTLSTVLLLLALACLPGCGAFDDGGNDLFVIDYNGTPFAQTDVLTESWGGFWRDDRTVSLEYSPEPFEDLSTRQILNIELRDTGGAIPELEDIWYGIRKSNGKTRAEWKVIRGRIAIQDWEPGGVVSADVDLELEDGVTVQSRFWINFARDR